jgi:hypothetical protein
MGKYRENTVINFSDEVLELLREYVIQYEEENTKSRSLDLLRSKKGMQKWHNGHYGCSLNTTLFVKKRVRQLDHVNLIISTALDRSGLIWSFSIGCTLDSLDEIIFCEFISDGCFAPPALFIARRTDGNIDVIFFTEDCCWMFNKSLWNALNFDQQWWLDEKPKRSSHRYSVTS